MEKVKIGQGYQPSAYGTPYNKKPVVWLINGKAYVKTSKTILRTDLDGYVMVNQSLYGFRQVNLITEHRQWISE